MEKVSAAAAPFAILDNYDWMQQGWNTSPQVLETLSFRIVEKQSSDPQQAARNTITEIFKKFPGDIDLNASSTTMDCVHLMGLAFKLGYDYGVHDTTHGERLIKQRLQNCYVLHPGFDSLTHKLAGRNPSDAEVLILAKRFCGPNHRDKNDESAGENMRSLREFVQKYGSKETVHAVEQMLLDMKPKPVYYNYGNWGL